MDKTNRKKNIGRTQIERKITSTEQNEPDLQLGKTSSRNIIREVNEVDWLLSHSKKEGNKSRDFYKCLTCQKEGVRKNNRRVHACQRPVTDYFY